LTLSMAHTFQGGKIIWQETFLTNALAVATLRLRMVRGFFAMDGTASMISTD
jgi:hypothetical protein